MRPPSQPEPSQPEPAATSGPVFGCGTCGRAVAAGDEAAARLSWTRSVEPGRVVWTCPACSRTFLRGIEGKLDSTWW